MKKTKFLFAALISASLLFSCSDDDDAANATLENQFTWMGSTYELGWGIAYDYGEFTTGFRNYDFVLTEKRETNLDGDDFESNHAIYLWLESSGANSFTAGNYVVGASSGNYVEEAELYFFNNDTEFEAVSGNINVSINGNNYTLEFDFTMDNDEKLVGKFSRSIEVIDETADVQVRTIDKKQKLLK